jgi:PhnB protein
MKIDPYLFFDGRCEEAIEFYKKAVGAKVGMLMRYRESPDKSHVPPGADDKVMHASLTIGDSTVMASDGSAAGKPSFEGFSLSLTLGESEAERVFKALSDGGEVRMPLGKTFFAPKFGMLADKFGVGWMIMAEPRK